MTNHPGTHQHADAHRRLVLGHAYVDAYASHGGVMVVDAPVARRAYAILERSGDIG